MKIFLKVLFGFSLLGLFVFLFNFANEKSLVFERTSAFHKANFSRESELLFVGDVMFARKIASLIEERGMDYPFELIKDRLNAGDMVIANLEGPISSRGKNQGSIYSFRFKPEIVQILKEANVGAVSLANNHMLDWGADAISDTAYHLDEAGIFHAGAGRDYEEANSVARFSVGGSSVALLSYTDLMPESFKAGASKAGISDFNLARAQSIILDLSKQVDLVLVSFHWGVEYETLSRERERSIARALVDAGADLIVGHHPHVAQEIEEYGGKYIAYSLGNFIFDQNFSRDTSHGLMLSVRVKNGEIESVEPAKVCFNELYQPFEC